MGKINRILLMFIAMGAILLAAVGVDRGMQYFERQRLETERIARYEKAYADVADIEMTISQLARDPKAIEAYLEEHREYFDQIAEPEEESFSGDMAGVSSADMDILSDETEEETETAGEVSGNSGESVWPERDSVSGNEGESVLAEGVWFFPDGSMVPGSGRESFPGGVWMPWEEIEGSSEELMGESIMDGNRLTVSGNGVGSISENRLSGMLGTDGVSSNGIFQVSGNELWSLSGEYRWDAAGNVWRDVSGNVIDPLSLTKDAEQEETSPQENSPQKDETEMTLLDRRRIRGSYMETRKQNEIDRKVIAESEVDFSGVSIACLGDSITEAANLSDQENYRQYAWPARLGALLGTENVTNLGIGGSSIGRYWENAFVDRYQEIPEDAELILVMGGTNDGFCMNQEELGTMQERKKRTFIGDLDELLKGLRENYPDAEVVLATPLPNVLHDILRKERDYLLPQSTIVSAMKQLAVEYEIPVIDLYNSNILDTHDAAVIYNYMPDGVHCNADGYQLLAEHFAAELIRMYQGGEEGKMEEEQ